ncbi:MAG: hypothetical protein M1839_004786 [Geoglossum umbratile]|nr:MAG: hypothetical protein M1839_004786 [Geoglossum umbratile]
MAGIDLPTQRPKVDDGPPRVAVKLSEDTQKRAKQDPKVIAGLLEKAIPGASRGSRVEPLITSPNPKTVDELVQRAAQLDPGYKPIDFGAWYQVRLGTGESVSDTPEGRFDPRRPDHVDYLVRNLNALAEVESSSALRPTPPPVAPGDDPLSTLEGYLDPAPSGIDARYAWNFPGGDGKGIGFVDVEQGWDLNHEDLVAANVTLISGTNTAYFYHGTSVLGEVLMADNTIGGIGIAPQATGRVISQHQPGGYNTPAAIIGAIAVMSFGDVLLLEAQTIDPVTNKYAPVEIEDATYDAIRLATALGIVVVEAAGNGTPPGVAPGLDLDTATNAAGKHVFNRGSPEFRDSGAIIVGAASSAVPHTRMGFSNYGSRIDVFGWGENIETTTTNGPGTDDHSYTSSFGGTSGASPINAGAAILVQAITQAIGVARSGDPNFRFRFSPLEMRRILTSNGTQSADPVNDKIGVMPDLRAICNGQDINIAPDIYLRDFVGDNGDPNGGAFSASPDIIVLQAPVANPTASFGPGSGTENNANLSQDIVTGQDQAIYLRLLNRGGSTATNVSVTVYYSAPSTLVTPNLWVTIGTTTLPSPVPINDVLTVSNTLVWPAAAIPSPGHYCFIAVAGNDLEPAPQPTDSQFVTFANYEKYIGNNNNVAWRNFNVVSRPPSTGTRGFHSFPFFVPGAFDAARAFVIEALGNLPRGSEVEIYMPLTLARQLKITLQEGQIEKGFAVLTLPASCRRRIGAGVIEKGMKAQCRVRVRVPEGVYKGPGRYEFAVRQLYNEKEVGRLTWHFGQHAAVC